MKSIKKSEAYLTEEEFNRMVAAQGVPTPEGDSPGDNSRNQRMETEMGEHFLDGNTEALTDLAEEDALDIAPSAHDSDEERIAEATTAEPGLRSSTWPDPSEITEDDLETDLGG
jgi:hypothetical protein